jgi:hypothetical protein
LLSIEPTVYESTVKISAEEEARESSQTFSSNNIAEVQQGMSAVSKDFDMAVVSCQPTEVITDLAQNEPFVFPVNKGLGEGISAKTATSIEYVQPVERTVSEILVRTPLKPPRNRFGGSLGWPRRNAPQDPCSLVRLKAKPSVEASPLPKMATQCTYPISFETSKVSSLEDHSHSDGPAPILKSPEESLGDLAKEGEL